MATAVIAKAKRTPAKPVGGRFGAYGGRYVPETLMAALEELERNYEKAKRDRSFQRRLDELLRVGRGNLAGQAVGQTDGGGIVDANVARVRLEEE